MQAEAVLHAQFGSFRKKTPQLFSVAFEFVFNLLFGPSAPLLLVAKRAVCLAIDTKVRSRSKFCAVSLQFHLFGQSLCGVLVNRGQHEREN